MDLMGPMQTESIGRKKYVLVCVDDFSRFTWVDFLREKSDTFEAFKKLCKRLMKEKDTVIGKIVRIRSDHGTEFENSKFSSFCDEHGIKHEFSAPKTPQQNGVVERKNRTIQEMARVMLNAKEISQKFWVEAVNTACYTINRCLLRPKTRCTPYELWKGRKPKLSYFHIFGSKCFIFRDRVQNSKFDPRSDEGIFLGYSTSSKAFRVYNKHTQKVMESINVTIHDELVPIKYVAEDGATTAAEESPDAEPEVARDVATTPETPQ